MHAWYAWTSSICAHVRAAAKDNNNDNNKRCACRTSRPHPCWKSLVFMHCGPSVARVESGAGTLQANEQCLLTANLTPPSAHTLTSAHHLRTAPSSPSTRGCPLALACEFPIVALHCIHRVPVQPASSSRNTPSISIPAHGTCWALFSLLFSKRVNSKSCFLVIHFFSSTFLFPKGLVLVVHTLQINNSP
jgi:hypothetical protein